MKTKIIESFDAEDLELQINSWLKKERIKPENVIDIQYFPVYYPPEHNALYSTAIFYKD